MSRMSIIKDYITNGDFITLKKNITKSDFQLIDEDGNNILLLILIYRFGLEDYDESIDIAICSLFYSFLILGNFDINHKNKDNYTVVSYVIRSTFLDEPNSVVESKKLLRRIFALGFTNYTFNVSSELTFKKFLKNTDEEFFIYIKNLTNKEDIVEEDEIKDYEYDDFKDYTVVGTGSYGKIYMAERKSDGKFMALKESLEDGDLSTDLFKEMALSKMINKINPGKSIMFSGLCRKEKITLLVTEFLEYRLKDILRYIRIFDISVKREFLLMLFKQIIESTNAINSAGIVHFDLKPENIMLTGKLQIKIIDLGLSAILGLEPKRLKIVKGTVQTRSPDTIRKKFDYLDDKDRIIFEKLTEYRVDYSADMFSIASFMLSNILINRKEHSTQGLFLGKRIFLFEHKSKDDNSTFISNIKTITNVELNTLNRFSIHFIDFLKRTLAVDSYDRMTCKEALDHPIFGKRLEESINVNFITDLNVNSFKNNVYVSRELRLKKHELKYLDEISNNYGKLIIPKSSEKYGDDHNSNLKTFKSEMSKEFENDYDNLLNFLVFYSIYYTEKNSPFSSKVERQVNDCISCLFDSELLDDDYTSLKIKKSILQSEYICIPFKSVIIAYISTLRLKGEDSQLISIFHDTSYIMLYNYMYIWRRDDVQINVLMDDFFNYVESLYNSKTYKSRKFDEVFSYTCTGLIVL